MEEIKIIQLSNFDIVDYLLSFYPLDKDISGHTFTQNGVQSGNMLDKLEPSFTSHLLNQHLFPASCSLKSPRYDITGIDIRWVHFIEYFGEGEQIGHSHVMHEDYGFIIYLNDCSDGATYFYNPDPTLSPFGVFPKKGRLVIFPSYIYHKASPTNQNKKIVVGSLIEIGKEWKKQI